MVEMEVSVAMADVEVGRPWRKYLSLFYRRCFRLSGLNKSNVDWGERKWRRSGSGGSSGNGGDGSPSGSVGSSGRGSSGQAGGAVRVVKL